MNKIHQIPQGTNPKYDKIYKAMKQLAKELEGTSSDVGYHMIVCSRKDNFIQHLVHGESIDLIKAFMDIMLHEPHIAALIMSAYKSYELNTMMDEVIDKPTAQA